ncbi:MAG: YihY/virulence factor BrkB family protein [Chloroflexi bacterium]|nr:YihY/virulence factor BrkB family protein [Chloroflexota bacterium]MBU1752125.1 YihY/virulence factor BrkB family protein [Chloroflexota bacterium]MBU1879092.1 YihY/virulence factor BrkB family protein [Chloroflexota bacterium]
MQLKPILQNNWLALLDRLPGPLARALWLGQQTIQGFVDHGNSARAATIAYYAFFAVFPLLLFIIVASSFFLEDQITQQQIYTYVEQYIPQAGRVVQDNIEQVLTARGTIGLVAAISLIWSASGVFSAATRAINRAWGIQEPRPIWEEKLLALSMVLVVSVLFLLSIVASAGASLLNQIMAVGHAWLGTILTIALPAGFAFVLLSLMYRLMPHVEVPWRAVLGGAALGAIAWEIGKDLFTLYLVHLARYELIYGQVEAFIVLLLYFYFTGAVLMVGAEFTVVYARWLQPGAPARPWHPAPVACQSRQDQV